MSTLTIAHVSDLHLPHLPHLAGAQRLSKRQLSVWSWQRRRELHQHGILDALVVDLLSHGFDHLVITGDVVNFSLPDEFRNAHKWLSALAPAQRISLVPGNHDALVDVPPDQGLARWSAWTRLGGEDWPFVHRVGDGVSLIGLSSAVPTAPLLARGRIGERQLERLTAVLQDEARERRVRIVLLHHPVAAGAVGWRKALADRAELCDVLKHVGAELVLHGHAREARLDSVEGPRGPIPCICVPSSSAVPNPKDEGARWHRMTISRSNVDVQVRKWSVDAHAFVTGGRYQLQL